MTQKMTLITDKDAMALATRVWLVALAFSSKKISAATKVLTKRLGDDMDLLESSINRKALHTRVSGIASSAKSSVKMMIVDAVKNFGGVPDPDQLCEDGETTLLDSTVANVLKRVKSNIAGYINQDVTEQVPVNVKDASGTPIDPIALDLSTLEWDEKLNEIFNNVYDAHVPSLSTAVKCSKDDAKACFAMS